MNDAMRKRIADLDLDALVDELEELLAQEEGSDGNRGHWKVRAALEAAKGAIAEVDYLATTPRKSWD